MPQYSIGGGFASRCIFVYADKKAKFIPYPDDYVPAGWANEKRKLTEDLIRISRISGEFKLSPEAREFGKDWYIKFHEEMPSHLKDDQLAGYAARKQTHLHKIAMCLSAARGDSKVIELEDMEMAISLLQVSEENMLKVFQSISDDKDATNLKIIKGKMALYPEGITQSDLYCDMSTRMGYDAFTRALDAGVSAGFFERVLRRNETVIRNATQAARNSVNVSKEDVARVKSLRKKA